jgi:hypothetical protein
LLSGISAPQSREQQIVFSTMFPHMTKNRDRGVGQRNAMLPTGFHSALWHNPNPRIDINLGPSRTKNFAGPCGGQNGEFECPSCDALTCAQRSHEDPDFLIRQ